MKITLEIPDDTRCAFFDFVYGSVFEMMMGHLAIGSTELYDGAQIKKVVDDENQD